MTNSKKAKRFQFWINVVLILITLSIVLPFVLVFISSLTDENTLIRNGYSFFPEKFSFYAYSYIIRQGEKILRAYGITVFVTIVGTAANIAMSALLAYPLSVKKLPYRRAITFFVFFTMLFNGGLVPTYLMYVKYFHIKNTIWALIVPGFLLSANNVLMIRSYFNTSIPDALFEAAKIDGASRFQCFRTITLPLVTKLSIPLVISTFAANFNNFGNIYMITQGGPARVDNQFAGYTDILASTTYKMTTWSNRYELSATFSVLIFLIVGTFTLINMRMSGAFKEVD